MKHFEEEFPKYKSMLKWYASKYKYRNVKASDHARDMYQEACIALWYACQHFDPTIGASFRTYAKRVVWTTLSNLNKRKYSGYKYQLSATDEPVGVTNIAVFEPSLARKFEQLSGRDKLIVNHIACDGDRTYGLKDELGVSRQRTHQVKKQTLKRLKRMLTDENS